MAQRSDRGALRALFFFVSLLLGPWRRHGVGVSADILPVDYFTDLGGMAPAIYKTAPLLGKTRVEFDDLDVTWTAWDTTQHQTVLVPATDPITMDVLMVRAKFDDTCQGYTLPQCLDIDNLAHHGIGIRDDKDADHHEHHGPEESLALCCTQDLLQQGKCTQVNTLIVNSTKFEGKHLQWTIPVNASQVSSSQLSNAALRLGSGRYLMVMTSCSMQAVPSSSNSTYRDYSIHLAGRVRLQSPWGYLPLSMIGIWLLFLVLFVAYAAILVWYSRQIRKTHRRQTPPQHSNNRHPHHGLRKSEIWVCFALVLGCSESLAHWVLWTALDETGHLSMTCVWIQNILNGVKMCVSFCLGIYLAQAAGYMWHEDDDSVQHSRMVRRRLPLALSVTLYAVLRTVQGVAQFYMLRPDWLESVSYQMGMTMAFIKMVCQQLVTLVSIGMVVWMLVAVSRTIRYFASLQTDRANRLRYVKLRFVLVITTVASLTTFACTSISLPFLAAYSYQYAADFGGPWLFYVSALNEVIYFVTLARVAYLWRPRANHVEDLYLTASLLNVVTMDDVQEVDAMEFADSVVTSPLRQVVSEESAGEDERLPEQEDRTPIDASQHEIV